MKQKCPAELNSRVIRIRLSDYLILSEISRQARVTMAEAFHLALEQQEAATKVSSAQIPMPAFRVTAPVALRVRLQPTIATNGNKAVAFRIKSTGKENNMRKIYLLDDEDCPPCEEVKKALQEEIASGKVEVLQVTSDEALILLEEAGAGDKVEFPSALVKDEKGVRLCQIYHSKDLTLSKCGEEIIAIRELGESPPAPTD